MGYVCEIFLIDEDKVRTLKAYPQLIEKCIDELEKMYNQPNISQSEMFYIDKIWRVCFNRIEKYLIAIEPNKRNIFTETFGGEFPKVITSKMVVDLNNFISNLKEGDLFIEDEEISINFKEIVINGVKEVKEAFNRAQSENKGLLLSVG